MSAPLLPCPFCGSENVGCVKYGSWCNRCDAKGPFVGSSDTEASRLAWNRRAQPTPEAVAEACARACEAALAELAYVDRRGAAHVAKAIRAGKWKEFLGVVTKQKGGV